MGLFDRRIGFSFFNEFNDGMGNTGANEDDEELETIGDDGETQEPEPTNGDENIETIDNDETGEEEENNPEPQNDTQEEPIPEEDNVDPEQDEEIEAIDNDETGEENPEDVTGDEDPMGGEEGDEEIETIDGDNDGMEGGEPAGDDGETGGGMDTGNDPHQKLKDLEAELFDQLSEEQKEIKRKELKSLFILIIEKCDNITKLIIEIPKTDETIKLIDYVNNTIMDLKTYLNDYVVNTYDSCTYLQNTVNFQKFLTVFDSIRAIFEDIKSSTTDTTEEE